MQLAPMDTPPKDLTAYNLFRTATFETRAAVGQARAALTSTHRKDATTTFWANRALTDIGRAVGMLQIAQTVVKPAGINLPIQNVFDALDGARMRLSDERVRVDQGAAPNAAVYQELCSSLADVEKRLGWWVDVLPPIAPPSS